MRGQTAHRFQPLTGTEHAGVETQFFRHAVPHGLHPHKPVIKVGIALPARRTWEARQFGLRRGQSTLDSLQQLAAALFQDPAGHPLDRRQGVSRPRLLARDGKQRLVAHHTERGTIQLAGHHVAPRHHLAQDGQLTAAQVARPLHLQESQAIVVFFPANGFQAAELLARPVQPPTLLQFLVQPVAQFQQPSRIL